MDINSLWFKIAMPTSVILIKDQLSSLSDLLNFFLDNNVSVSMATDINHAFSILAQESHYFQGIIIEDILLEKSQDFILQLKTHQSHAGLPIIIHGQLSVDDYIKGFPRINEKEDSSHILKILKDHLAMSKVARSDFGVMKKSVFEIKNLNQAQLLSIHLSSQFPNPEHISVGISELLLNAIEHGNLEISFDDKSELLKKGIWLEEVQKRLKDPAYSSRFATVVFERLEDRIKLTIEDQGKGFNWQSFEQFDPRRMLAAHGRGIMMARSFSFSSLTYNEKGNIVSAELLFNPAS